MCAVIENMGTNATNVIKRYFHGQTWYFTGHGWSNVSARAQRFEDLCDAESARRDIPEDCQVDAIVLGRNQVRIFDCRRY